MPLDENGEPQLGPEDKKATSLDPWTATCRAPWEKHSEMGPNLRRLRRAPNELLWVLNIIPPEYAWNARWLDIDVHKLRRLLDARRETEVEYDRPELTKESLGDPYQRMFQ